MAKYNFWVRTTKQTNHPMKGIEMEFGDCLQMFNDYMTLLEKHGCEIIDAEIYRIQPGAEVPADKETDAVTPLSAVIEAIRSEAKQNVDFRFTRENILAYNGVNSETVDGILESLERNGRIVRLAGGYAYVQGVIQSVCSKSNSIEEYLRNIAGPKGEFNERRLPTPVRASLRGLFERGIIECVHATGGDWRILPMMSPLAGSTYYRIKVALRMKESPLSFRTLLAEIGEENKPELQATLNELTEVGLIKRLAGGKGGCRYDVTFKPNII